MDKEDVVTPRPALLSLQEVGPVLGLGQTMVKELIASGRIVSVKIGRRRLVPAQALDAFVAELIRQSA